MGGLKGWGGFWLGEFLRVLKVFKVIRVFNDAGNRRRKDLEIFEGTMSEKRTIKEGAGGVIGEGRNEDGAEGN